MARKHPPKLAPTAGSAAPILPLALVERPTPDRGSDWDHERTRWFVDHGIDPGDWDRVHAVLVASDRFHGIPNNALDRAWVRSIGLDKWRRIHQDSVRGDATEGRAEGKGGPRRPPWGC